jgi:muramoyltetrapeptide carboxypeptidase
MSHGSPATVPCALRNGDTIAFTSPSGRLNSIFPARIERAKTYLENQGFIVRVVFNTPEPSDFAQRVKQRVDELHSAFLDPSIKAIICTIGGLSANELLRHIDYNIIRSNPKIFCGYSDITLLHYAFFTQANLQTFYGPAAITQFGEFPHPLPFTTNHFFHVLQHSTHGPLGQIPRSTEWTQQFLDWETGADATQPRELQRNPGPRWIRPGAGTGRIFGGCLPSILQLRGTVYEPDYRGRVLMLETPEWDKPNTAMPLEFVRSNLADLVNAGIFDHIIGLVLGRPYAYDEAMSREFEQTVLDQCHGTEFPILAGVDFGHTDPILTIPMNALVRLDSGGDVFEGLEPAVLEPAMV